ncbi:endo alpha-1,4 polygalactosaminidase [Hahella ganghwensis]|uniref:endo alpha-1,4 polygalactosaminidase n=1 Tax=Hahella ganghwensis TaxID=286420 RepID=UPI000379F3D4|nr:endo alpha-1,4 polygalactosaminidase [Hahella ganghwensis]
MTEDISILGKWKNCCGALFVLLALSVSIPAQAESGWKAPEPEFTWFWQLDNESSLDLPFDVYDVSLYDVSESYLKKLKSQGVYLICYFSLGTSEEYNPDRAKFQKGDLGAEMDGHPTERWVNPESGNVRQIMLGRLDYARKMGCDAVEPDNLNYQDKDTGFDISPSQQLAFLVWFSQEAHKRGLAVGLKNNLDQAEVLQPYFDFAINEQCFEYDECDVLEVFSKAGKAIFNAEYLLEFRENNAERDKLCKQALDMNMRTLVLNEELDGSYFYSCDLMYVE